MLVREKSKKAISVTFVLAVMGAAAACHSSTSSAGSAGVTADQTPLTQTSQTAAPATSAPAASRSTSAAAAGAASAPASASASAQAAHAGATSTTGSRSGGGTTGSPAGNAPGKPTGFTRAGSYTYDLSGTATQPFGGSSSVSGTQSFVVDPPSGSSQHSKATGQNGSQDMTLTVRSSGLYVDDVHISQQGFDEDFRPVGTALYFPAGYRTGSHWSWRARSTDGKYTLDVMTKVSGSGTQAVGGTSQKALVVDSTLHIAGAGFDITSQQRDWVSVKYALILKEHAVTNGSAYGAKISSDVTRTLRSTEPS